MMYYRFIHKEAVINLFMHHGMPQLWGFLKRCELAADRRQIDTRRYRRNLLWRFFTRPVKP